MLLTLLIVVGSIGLGCFFLVRAYQLERNGTSAGLLIFFGICSIAAGPVLLNIAANGISNLGNVLYFIHLYSVFCLALTSAYYFFRVTFEAPSMGAFAMLAPLTEKGRYYRRMFFLFLGLWFLWVVVGGLIVLDYDLEPK